MTSQEIFKAIDQYIRAVYGLTEGGSQPKVYIEYFQKMKETLIYKAYNNAFDVNNTPQLVTDFVNTVNKQFSAGSAGSASLQAPAVVGKKIGIRSGGYKEGNATKYSISDIATGETVDIVTYDGGNVSSKVGSTIPDAANFLRNPGKETIVVYIVPQNSLYQLPDEYGIPDVTNAEISGLPWYIWAVGGFFLWRVLK